MAEFAAYALAKATRKGPMGCNNGARSGEAANPSGTSGPISGARGRSDCRPPGLAGAGSGSGQAGIADGVDAGLVDPDAVVAGPWLVTCGALDGAWEAGGGVTEVVAEGEVTGLVCSGGVAAGAAVPAAVGTVVEPGPGAAPAGVLEVGSPGTELEFAL